MVLANIILLLALLTPISQAVICLYGSFCRQNSDCETNAVCYVRANANLCDLSVLFIDFMVQKSLLQTISCETTMF